MATSLHNFELYLPISMGHAQDGSMPSEVVQVTLTPVQILPSS